ncbi:MAG TPA: GNAT family N-acetyltransferase [Gammaproteobacteria bacterium]
MQDSLQAADVSVTLTPAAHGQADLTVERISDIAGLEALGPEWQALLQGNEADCLFLTWEWQSRWWRHVSQRRRLCLLTVRRGGELVAIAPFAIRPPEPGRLVPFRTLEFMGMGDVGSDYLDLIIRPDQEAPALEALADYLKQNRLVLDFRRVDAGSRRIAGLLALLRQDGWETQQEVTDVCPYIPLQGHDWKSYIATVSRSHRANVNRRIRRLGEIFKKVEFKQATTEEERRECFTQFLRLHQLRWSGKERSNAFTGEGTLAFHAEFSQLALERGWLRLFVLRLDGEPAAATYSFRYGDKFYYYQAGLDPKLAEHSVGLATLGLAVQSALKEGVRGYDMLHGNQGYKTLWTDSSRPLSRIYCYPPNAGGTLYRQAQGLRNSLKRVLRWPVARAEARA